MSDVYLAFGTLLSLGIVFPGLIFTWWLLFPNLTGRAEERLAQTPGRTFLFGLAFTLGTLFFVLILAKAPLPGSSAAAAGIVVITLAVAAIGAAGLTGQMAQRLRERSNSALSPAAAFVRAVIALELAAAFPVLGWFLFTPLCVIISLGAAIFALLGWRPRLGQEARTSPLPVTMQATGAGDVA